MPASQPVPTAPTGGVPITLHPGQDVHLQAGLSLGALRDAVAVVTGRDELREAQLHVGDRILDDDHVVGQPPLVAGALLRSTRGTPDPASHALGASLHLAHLAGPRAGFVCPVVPGPARPSGPAVVWGVDVRAHVRHEERVRVRIRPRRSCRAVLVESNGRARRVRRARLRRWVTWKVGSTLEVTDLEGRTTSRTELRGRPRLADATFSALTRALVDDATGRTPPAAPTTRSPVLMLSTALLPALASVGLAVALRNPLFAIMAVVGPLLVLGPAVARRRRTRLAEAGRPSIREEAPSGRPCPHAGLRPVDLLTAALASSAVPRQDLVVRDSPGRVPRPARRTSAQGDLPVLPGDLRSGCLAVVGARPEVLSHAGRTIVALHAVGRATRIVVVAPPERTPEWAWARWIPGSSAMTPSSDRPLPSAPGTLLVVDADRTPELNAQLGAWHAVHGEHAALVVLGDDAASVPSWCSAVAAVTPESVLWTAPGHATARTPFDGVGTRWLDAYSRRVCALVSTARWVHLDALAPTGAAAHLGAGTDLPRSVALAGALDHVLDLGSHPPGAVQPLVSAISQRWTRGGRQDLCAPIGIGADGRPVAVDLLADGPHALVAGTTGAGKSELLQTLVLALALRSSPDDLAIALVDYKGGASFGACVDLPHVVGQVTDLDPGIAERALDGLRAELRRRERLFAEVGAANLDDYRAHPDQPERLPRLLVVVDEFRAMADDHPRFIPGLVRIAAQGRSLGVHLVLATQRPGGAITPDMRANISLRIALRVVDEGDSGDIIDSPAAASIPADAPGRALVRRGLTVPEIVQTFHAGGIPPSSERRAWPAPRWDGREPEPAWSFPAPSASRDEPATDPARDLVDAALAAARALSVERPRVPWTPDLPSHTSWRAGPPGTGSASSLVLGVADLPEAQRHEPFGWDVEAGHLLVVGRAGTGRTTALRTVVHAARAAGFVVHVVGPPSLVPHPRRSVATVVDASDPRRLARLLSVLLTGAPAPDSGAAARKHVLVIDGLEDVQRSLASLRRGAGGELLTSVLRDGVSRGIHVAVAATGVPSTSLSALLSQRILFSGRQKHDDAYLGIPTDLAGRGGVPGRAVLVGSGPALRCQVAVAGDPLAGAPQQQGDATVQHVAVADLDLRRWTVEPVPRYVSRADLTGAPDGADGVLRLGRGGDLAETTGLVPGRGLLVCGPHGSGRSAALAEVARATRGHGEIAALVSRDLRLGAVATRLGCVRMLTTSTPHATADFVQQLSELGTRTPGAPHATEAPRTRRRFVLVDDLDVVAQTCPAALEAVQRLLEGSPDTVVVASATTTSAAGAFRGLLAELRSGGRGIVLDPGTPGSSEVFGVDLGWVVEPEVHLPGRGALVDGRRSWLVQLAHDSDAAD